VSEEIITHSAEETIAWGRELAENLQPPLLVLLSGELGSGKTTLTKGIVAGLHAAEEDQETLGLEDVFAEPAIVILEWSEKFPLKARWPLLRLRLEHMGGDARRITVLNPAI
jgi:tRNA threonylcarbamoyladenosine biosynthesis protein TsaE